ncbi:efflux RND transporter permease subunit [Phenylobacterium sp.]|jgi:multidrug efflux pump|uniref:efflux RND transporter permease subunit n=1 Tax=Phenylobacterium sp. TaxID=1871053 RepID=UPI002F41E41E
MIGALIDGAIKRRKVVLGVTVIACLFGLFAYLSMPREANPDIDLPYIYVTVPFPGVSPEDAERLIIKPLEVELQTIQGVKHLSAVAREGVAVAVLEFDPNFPKQKALDDVRSKVDLARARFPPDAEPPDIEEQSYADQPVIEIVLHGAAPERELARISRDLKERLESSPGVQEAFESGARTEMLEVAIDPLRMEAYNVTANDLSAVIARNNQLVPAGDLRSGAGLFAMKIPGVVQKPADILALPIKKNGDKLVTIGDIGSVRRTFKEPDFITRFNGQPAVALDVTKRNGANILETVRTVRKVVADEQKQWPATVRVDYTHDTSDYIGGILTMLQSGIITASLLVMLIVVASLGIRQGILVGLAIPVCFLIAFMMIHGMGVTLNQMVMYGMVLAVGILVDGGIVVVEYADRKMAEGMPKAEAFAAAGKRMFWPVVNGTLTTLSAFLPFLFWDSVVGKMMSFLPLTLLFVLGASIFVALIFTPALGSIFGRAAAVDAAHLAEIEKSEHGDPRQMTGFMGWYARSLDYLGHHPGRTGAAALLVIVVILGGFIVTPHRTEFFINQDPDEVTVYIKARGNLSPEAQDELTRQVEARLMGIKGVQDLYVRAGGVLSNGGPGSPPNDTVGRIEVQFDSYAGRKALGLSGEDVATEIRNRVANLPGMQIEVREPESGPPIGKAIQVQLQSHDPAALNKAADIVKAKFAADPQLIDQEDNRTSPGIEYNLAVDRVAAGRYGVDVLSVGQAIQFLTDGVLVGRYRPDDVQDELDIRVRFPATSRTVAAFDQLKITTPSGPVPASYFVKQVPAQQVSQIQRREGQRLVLVQANTVKGVAANQKIAQLKPWIAKAGLDPEVHVKFVGADEEGNNAILFFLGAAGATIFLMGTILLWQFNSFYGMVVTLFAVILSTIGVILGIEVNFLHTFDYISVILVGTGVVALFGVVVGHNIVLVDTFYQLRRQGFPADEAAVRAAAQRFRPVMLTTVVTVAGLLPMMFQISPNFGNGHIELKSPGSEWWVQLSAAVIWGLSFSTLLTLMLTPVMLAAPKVMSARFQWLWRLVRGAPAPKPVKPYEVPRAAE